MPERPAAVEEAAPAKVNLALHVTGRRPDGYHLLDSLVVFAPRAADRVRVRAAERHGLRVEGPFAGALAAEADNLVLRAARMIDPEGGAEIVLDKRLPVASGIGGGSADAAATLRALARLRGLPLPGAAAVLALGADVPVCLAGQPARMRGIGERVEPLPGPVPLHMVLVNPGVAVGTPAVFAALERRDSPPLPAIPAFADAAAVIRWLEGVRNDLEAPAARIAPAIGQALAALRGAGAALARMSGSGATCFGLWPDAQGAARAASALAAAHPGWWVAEA